MPDNEQADLMPKRKDGGEIHAQFKAADAAYRRGEIEALRAALGDPENFPNCKQRIELGLGAYPLDYAIHWSPVSFVRDLIAAGADVNYDDGAGFPSLISTISPDRTDKHEIEAFASRRRRPSTSAVSMTARPYTTRSGVAIRRA
jgi:hypothetical protein